MISSDQWKKAIAEIQAFQEATDRAEQAHQRRIEKVIIKAEIWKIYGSLAFTLAIGGNPELALEEIERGEELLKEFGIE